MSVETSRGLPSCTNIVAPCLVQRNERTTALDENPNPIFLAINIGQREYFSLSIERNGSLQVWLNVASLLLWNWSVVGQSRSVIILFLILAIPLQIWSFNNSCNMVTMLSNYGVGHMLGICWHMEGDFWWIASDEGVKISGKTHEDLRGQKHTGSPAPSLSFNRKRNG